MDFGEKPRRRLSINITSLVDILIVLLLFFMLTTQFIQMEVLHLNLSGKSSQNEPSTDGKAAITITLVGGGRFMLEGGEFNLLELKDKLKPKLGEYPEGQIIISSRIKASVQDIVSAMDYIKAIGGNNISVQEESSDAGK